MSEPCPGNMWVEQLRATVVPSLLQVKLLLQAPSSSMSTLGHDDMAMLGRKRLPTRNSKHLLGKVKKDTVQALPYFSQAAQEVTTVASLAAFTGHLKIVTEDDTLANLPGGQLQPCGGCWSILADTIMPLASRAERTGFLVLGS